ncbi:MAG: CopG family ribbon-helix-helix protein [Candidatus Woesearchaeota archaeon]
MIVSISLNEKNIEDIDRIAKEQGYNGRSEVIRAGLRLLINEEKQKEKLKGFIEGVLIVVNKEEDNDEISKIRHLFNDIIKTQIHNHLESHNCLQIFVLNGDSEKIKLFVNKLETCKKTEYVKLIVS